MRSHLPILPRWRGAAIVLPVGTVVLGLLWGALRFWPYPELDAFLLRPYCTEFYDRNGVLLSVSLVDGGLDRRRVFPDELPREVMDRFLEAEDRRFWFHPGVDPVAIVRAAFLAARTGSIVSGASTIDMQLARMVQPRFRSARGKLRELIDALRLNARLGKAKILELYLSNVPYGRGAEGIESAAFVYFGKRTKALTPYEAGVLAVLPRAPARLDPAVNPEGLTETATRAFLRGPLGKGSRPEELLALFVSCVSASARGRLPTAAPHFVRDAVRPLLSTGTSGAVHTTLDSTVQGVLEAAIRDALEGWRDSRLTNGAGLVLNVRTGEILAWMGSADFWNLEDHGQMDGVIAPFQPGSCLKPFLYAMALDRGFTPATILPDVPLEFGSSSVYVPLNFNNRYNGPVRLRVALASSLNVPAVYTLNRLGVQNFVDYLIGLGFETLRSRRDFVGVGLALGNTEVTLLELTRAFSVFLRGGTILAISPLLPAAKVDLGREDAAPIMSAYAAETVRSILSDPASRFMGFGEGSAFDVPFDAIFKTGTANQYQHVWALGSAGDWVVGVWMGNFLGETIIGRTGSGIPARGVARVLSALVPAGTRFSPPVAEAVESRICHVSGLTATGVCPSTIIEEFRPNEVPKPCNWHLRDGGTIRTSFPPEYAAWIYSGARSGEVAFSDSVPRILRPSQGAIFWYDPTRPASDQWLVVQVAPWPENAQLLYDGEDQGNPSRGRFLIPISRGVHRLELLTGGQLVERVEYSVR